MNRFHKLHIKFNQFWAIHIQYVHKTFYLDIKAYFAD